MEGCDFKTERWGMECKGRGTMKCCVFLWGAHLRLLFLSLSVGTFLISLPRRSYSRHYSRPVEFSGGGGVVVMVVVVVVVELQVKLSHKNGQTKNKYTPTPPPAVKKNNNEMSQARGWEMHEASCCRWRWKWITRLPCGGQDEWFAGL